MVIFVGKNNQIFASSPASRRRAKSQKESSSIRASSLELPAVSPFFPALWLFVTPLKSKIDTRNSPCLGGDTFSKPSFLVSMLDFRGIGFSLCFFFSHGFYCVKQFLKIGFWKGPFLMKRKQDRTSPPNEQKEKNPTSLKLG